MLREFAVSLEAPVDAVLDHCAERGVAAGIPLGRDYPEHRDGLLVAITEQRSAADIERLAAALGEAGSAAGAAPSAGAADATPQGAGAR